MKLPYISWASSSSTRYTRRLLRSWLWYMRVGTQAYDTTDTQRWQLKRWQPHSHSTHQQNDCTVALHKSIAHRLELSDEGDMITANYRPLNNTANDMYNCNVGTRIAGHGTMDSVRYIAHQCKIYRWTGYDAWADTVRHIAGQCTIHERTVYDISLGIVGNLAQSRNKWCGHVRKLYKLTVGHGSL